ncbi:hypothetical protein ACP8HI_06280 [Paenibacillus sp. FA6]|uniref:hypothetical protein n=1 Tax=Paenibacillus sp. FA6 TaxID=3413029 RepID=UPI003F65FFC7
MEAIQTVEQLSDYSEQHKKKKGYSDGGQNDRLRDNLFLFSQQDGRTNQGILVVFDHLIWVLTRLVNGITMELTGVVNDSFDQMIRTERRLTTCSPSF